jgi:hypothetical protein
MSVSILGYHQILPAGFSNQHVSQIENLSFLAGEILLDRSSPFFPNRSDEKIMRIDVVASIIAINSLFEKFKTEAVRDDFSLYVASGVFIEKIENHTKHLIKVYEELNEQSTAQETMQKVYRGSPPLLALQTLTNSAMSFISQYTGIKGNNATFGTTSISGFYALHEAYNSTFFDTTPSVVCATNGGGAHSYLMNSPMYENKVGWKESTAVACLLLGKNDAGMKSVCEITALKTTPFKSQLENQTIKRGWADLISESKAELVIFSGAFTASEQLRDKEYCDAHWSRSLSLFDEFGNMGTANSIASIIKGIELLESNFSKIDIVDRDIYGSESWIRIEKNK